MANLNTQLEVVVSPEVHDLLSLAALVGAALELAPLLRDLKLLRADVLPLLRQQHYDLQAIKERLSRLESSEATQLHTEDQLMKQNERLLADLQDVLAAERLEDEHIDLVLQALKAPPDDPIVAQAISLLEAEKARVQTRDASLGSTSGTDTSGTGTAGSGTSGTGDSGLTGDASGPASGSADAAAAPIIKAGFE